MFRVKPNSKDFSTSISNLKNYNNINKFEKLSIEKFSLIFKNSMHPNSLEDKSENIRKALEDCMQQLRGSENLIKIKDEELVEIIKENKNEAEAIKKNSKELEEKNLIMMEEIENLKTSNLHQNEYFLAEVRKYEQKILNEKEINEKLKNIVNENALHEQKLSQQKISEYKIEIENYLEIISQNKFNFEKMESDSKIFHLQILEKESIISNLRNEKTSLTSELISTKNQLELSFSTKKEIEKDFFKNISRIKETLLKQFDLYGKSIITTENILSKKLSSQKTKIEKLKKTISNFSFTFSNLKNELNKSEQENFHNLSIYSYNKREGEDILKEKISKLESEKLKLISLIENFERKENKKIIRSDIIIQELKIKLEAVYKEHKTFIEITIPHLQKEIIKSKLEFTNSSKRIHEIQEKLNQYVVENNGMRKIIEERNEEIKMLKDEHSK